MDISNQIIAIIDDLCRRFGIVIDWADQNIMPYLEELAQKFVTLEVKTSWFWMIFTSVVAFLFWATWAILGFKTGFDDELTICTIVISTVFTVITLVVIGVQTYDIIVCEAFPEKILFREVKELLNAAKNY